MAEPLNVLLWSVFAELEREFDAAARDRSLNVSLELHQNVLRHIGDDGLVVRVLPRLARVTKRAAHYAVEVSTRWGWVTVEPDPASGGTRAHFTPQGSVARDESARCLDAAEEAIRARFGDDVVTSLRTSLAALVGRLDLELPHYPTGYGPADSSVTGGVSGRWGRPHARRSKGLPDLPFDPQQEHRLAEEWERESGGRLYVAAHGQDWKPVPRGDGDSVGGLSLCALLSQAWMALAIDYEGSGGLSLAATARTLRHIGDDGVPVTLKPSRSRTASGPLPTDPTLAGLERHGYATIRQDPADTRRGHLRLADKGRAVRDSYGTVLAAVEQRWERRYGKTVVRTLRTALGTMAGQLEHNSR